MTAAQDKAQLVTDATLNPVVAGVLADVAEREAQIPFKEIKARSRDMPETRDVRAALLGPGCGIIVEIKRTSPVFGPTGVINSMADLGAEIEAGGRTHRMPDGAPAFRRLVERHGAGPQCHEAADGVPRCDR